MPAYSRASSDGATRTVVRVGVLFAALTIGLSVVASAANAEPIGGPEPSSFLPELTSQHQIASTVPGNGDQNPYGVAVVPRTSGRLHRGHVLVANFNDGANLAGRGSTIMDVAPGGQVTTFAHILPAALGAGCPGGVGLTTALAVLRRGWVVVGNLPTADGTPATAARGCLIVLNNEGDVVSTISNADINGPWDMATVDHDDNAILFVTSVLNGTVGAHGQVVHKGTVVRIRLTVGRHHPPRVKDERVIATGFAEMSDPAALVIGPTGLGVGYGGVLYVADAVDNRIVGIHHPFDRRTAAPAGAHVVTTGGLVNQPLGLTVAPNGHLLSVNGNDGNVVETTPAGVQVGSATLAPVPGALFGLAITPDQDGVYFVRDDIGSLNILTEPTG